QQQNVKGQWEEIQEGASFILRMLGPAHTKVGQLGWRVKTERTAVLVVLALQQWQLDKGLYPANLDELVAAGYLKEMPMDPFSGKPLVYKKTDDGFTLYSVGLNFTDDGGIVGRDKRDRVSSWADEGDTIFWPTE
ncbi:MAG: hypothetical protein ACYST9_00875, partial [Planctomycetota bacterium]